MIKDQEEHFNILNSCIEKIIYTIDIEKRKIENRELLSLCRDLGGIFDDTTDSHFLHETAEAALNLLIKRKYAGDFLTGENQNEKLKQILRPISERLPTQTWRSRRQCALQQFSTPPAIGFLLVYLLNLKPSEQILEPSAGTGNLAVWAAGGGFQIHTNEIDPRRRALLRNIGFASTAFDAKFINDFLSEEVNIDCVLMNPPFSSNGERTKNNSSKFGFRHVESALERLKRGGKFGIVLGDAAGLDTKTGNDFWSKLGDRIEVKTIIKISGREYYKNGTSVDINLVVGEKLLETRKLNPHDTINQIICVSARTIEEAFEQVQKLNLRLLQ